MAGMGPPPAAQRRRRNAPTANLLRLPAGGRTGPTPKWPLPMATTPRLRGSWQRLWHLPQAVAWETQHLERQVARYAWLLHILEAPPDEGSEHLKAALSLMPEVRQLEDRLGLSSLAMLRLRWEIVDDDAAAGTGPRAGTPPAPTRTDPRLRLVQ